MAIHKIISVRPEHGKFTVGVVLDGAKGKRLSYLGDLDDDDRSARSAILKREEELYEYGTPWDDSSTNIIIEDEQEIDDLSGVTPQLKRVLKRARKAREVR